MTLGDVTAERLSEAIRLFVQLAYGDAALPERPQRYLAVGETGPVTLDRLLALPGVERLPPTTPGRPGGYSLRVGNAWFPHMKITVQSVDVAGTYVIGVDTHDTLRLPAGHPEEAGVKALQTRNLELARKVHKEWDAAGLPTQLGLLRNQLAAFAAKASPAADAVPESGDTTR